MVPSKRRWSELLHATFRRFLGWVVRSCGSFKIMFLVYICYISSHVSGISYLSSSSLSPKNLAAFRDRSPPSLMTRPKTLCKKFPLLPFFSSESSPLGLLIHLFSAVHPSLWLHLDSGSRQSWQAQAYLSTSKLTPSPPMLTASFWAPSPTDLAKEFGQQTWSMARPWSVSREVGEQFWRPGEGKTKGLEFSEP